VRADPASHGDAVLARKELPTSYHLAVTVGRCAAGCHLGDRGEDLFTATHIHRYCRRCSTRGAALPPPPCTNASGGATPSATAAYHRGAACRRVQPQEVRALGDSLTEGGAPERRNAGVRQSSIQLLAQSRNDRDMSGSSA